MDEERWISWQIQTSKRWSDMEDVLKYTNIDFIDYDHKHLVQFAFKLNQILDKSEREFSLSLIEDTKVLLNELYAYAQEHFDREEKFMDLYDLPDKDMHKREHKKILRMLTEALDNFNSGKIKLSRKLKDQVMDWLIKHINTFDYNFFDISNWSKNIINASKWNEIKPIIGLIGINEIDKQHKTLTEIALKTMKNISNNPTDDVIIEECKNLSDYASFHFDYEAGFMEKYNIKEPENHLREHNLFLDKINNYSVEIMQDTKKIDEMKGWILTWWISHINCMDKEYFAYKNWAYKLIEQAEKLEDVIMILRKTGIEEIDNDHIMLMDLTLKLNTLIKMNDENIGNDKEMEIIKDKVIAILDKTYIAAENHFKREEKMMQVNQMDDLKSHSSEHLAILKKITDLKENYYNDRVYLSSNIKTMILEWWIQHTNTTDFRTFVQNYKVNLVESQDV